MKLSHLNPAAGAIGFLTILTFWLSTVLSEIFGGAATITAVKTAILWGMIVLVPALMATGASGFALARSRSDPEIRAKKRRMPVIALNGLLILIPSAVFLQHKAALGQFDTAFVAVQAVELLAGGANLVLMGLNIRDGLALRGRRRGPQAAGT